MNVNPQPHLIIPLNLMPIMHTLLTSKQQPPPLTNEEEETAWKMAKEYRISVYRFPGPLASTARALQGAQKHFFKKLFTFKETPQHAIVEDEAVIYPLDEIDRERIVFYQGSLLDLLTDRSLKKHVHDETRIRWNQVGRQIKVMSSKFRATLKRMGGVAPAEEEVTAVANPSNDEASEGESGTTESSLDTQDASAMIVPRASKEPVPLITIMEPLAAYNYTTDYTPPAYDAQGSKPAAAAVPMVVEPQEPASPEQSTTTPSSPLPKPSSQTESTPTPTSTSTTTTPRAAAAAAAAASKSNANNTNTSTSTTTTTPQITRQQHQQGSKAVSSPVVPKHQPYGGSPKITIVNGNNKQQPPPTLQQLKPPLQPHHHHHHSNNNNNVNSSSYQNISAPPERTPEEVARLAARSRELRKQKMIDFVSTPPPPVQQNIIRLTDQSKQITQIQEMKNTYLTMNRIDDSFYNRGKIPFFKLISNTTNIINQSNNNNDDNNNNNNNNDDNNNNNNNNNNSRQPTSSIASSFKK
ncbi:pleckstrin domain-containing protein [Cavenderia fasciculata]|uniref:Pleckstrin domain-containing protein n=1 Tax=Cavenderia fasciculata TaxID=261658 RepID=F4PWJ2_CACFS|nr:pleckstrin domain-containing protein [Cavenderia fasciculata]EGG20356.1 pleckstrin domain-containing protein [Cavenderia fasciculata]|eukprot:XP_004367339.1 pleckstrin domain-containing protein [Cavenderia fasciculata]